MNDVYAPLQKERYAYIPGLPTNISGDFHAISMEQGGNTEALDNRDEIKALFPHTYGKPIVSFVPGAHSTAHSTALRPLQLCCEGKWQADVAFWH